MFYSLAPKEPPTMPPNFLQGSDIRLIRNTYIWEVEIILVSLSFYFFFLNRYIFRSPILSQKQVKRSRFSTAFLKKRHNHLLTEKKGPNNR